MTSTPDHSSQVSPLERAEQIWITLSTPQGQSSVYLVFSDIGDSVLLSEEEHAAVQAAVQAAMQMDAQPGMDPEPMWLSTFCARIAHDEIDGVRLVAAVLSQLKLHLPSERLEFVMCFCGGGKPHQCKLGVSRMAEVTQS